MVQGSNLDSGVSVSLFFVWQLDGAVAQQTLWKQNHSTYYCLFQAFLASSHRDSRIHAGEREDWCCLYTINRRGGRETKSLLENRRFLCSLRSFGIWSLKEYFSLWSLDHSWALSSSYRLSARPRWMSGLPSVHLTILPFPLPYSSRPLYVRLWKFAAATIGMSLGDVR